MYSTSVRGLGEEASSNENSGGFLNSLTNFLNTAVQTGGSVYTKVQQLTMANQQAKQQAEMNAAMMQANQWQMMRGMSSGSSMGGWLWPALLIGGGLAVYMIVKK